ncbi:hypothetical protein MTO96_041192, partial [Rhipicephalus appendiculatus]
MIADGCEGGQLTVILRGVIPPHHAAENKMQATKSAFFESQNYPVKIYSKRGDGIQGPWRFMTSNSIYLNMSSVKIPSVLCIKAKTTAKHEYSKTLSQKVDFKLRGDGTVTWRSMNASYAPIEFTRGGRVKTFNSYSN